MSAILVTKEVIGGDCRPVDVPEYVERLRPYVPGKPIEEVQRELGLRDVLKLASNENPIGPSPRAIKAIRDHSTKVSLYPEGAAPLLRAAVAAKLGVDENMLVFGNGSDEILHLICETFLESGKHETVQADPSFAMYEIYATLANARVVKVPLRDHTHDLDAMADAITERTRVIFVANPNNPTGTLVTSRQVERFLDRVPDHVLTVFDEAYYEYVETAECPNLLPLIAEGRNAVVTRTFSKLYALAGLRVGYGITRKDIAAYLNRTRSPFNVNLVAQAAALAALADTEHAGRSLAVNSQGKLRLYAGFEKLGLEYVKSEANFVIANVRQDSKDVCDKLLRQGVIVRAGAGLGMPEYIRVTVGTADQIDRFLGTLEKVLSEEKRVL